MSDFNGPLSNNEPKELDAAKALFDSWNERGKCLARIAEILGPKIKEPLFVDYGPQRLPRVQVMLTEAEARELKALLERR